MKWTATIEFLADISRLSSTELEGVMKSVSEELFILQRMHENDPQMTCSRECVYDQNGAHAGMVILQSESTPADLEKDVF